MVIEVVDAVVVVDAAVGLDAIFGAQPVLDDEQRLLIAVVQHVEQVAQPDRVDLPPHSELARCGFGTISRMLPRAVSYCAGSAVTQPLM